MLLLTKSTFSGVGHEMLSQHADEKASETHPSSVELMPRWSTPCAQGVTGRLAVQVSVARQLPKAKIGGRGKATKADQSD